MEGLQLPTLPILFTFLAFLFVLLILWSKPRHKNLPPGPKKLPIIGNLHNLRGRLPHQAMARLAKKYGPIMHLQLGQVSSIVFTSPDMAREVLKNHDQIFASRPRTIAGEIILYNSTNLAFSPYGEYWRQLRKISVMELLSVKRVHSFGPIREEEVSALIREISSSARKPTNLTKMLYSMTHKIVVRALIGRKAETGGRYARLTKEIMAVLGGYGLPEFFPSFKFLSVITGMRSRFRRLREEADDILDKAISERMELRQKLGTGMMNEEAEDILHVLLDLLDKGEIGSTNNIKAVIQDLILAGIEPSATTIEWAMVEMIRSPRVLEKATKEVRDVFDKQGKVDETELHQLQYMKLVLKETLRLHPPAPVLVPRESTEKCEINGYEIPAKSRVFVNVWAINRDPNYWEDAETFCPERFQENGGHFDYRGTHFEYLPFGSGRRMCPGGTYGLAIVELGLANLLYHFDWKLPDGQKNEDLSVAEFHGLAIRRLGDLHVIPSPYHH